MKKLTLTALILTLIFTLTACDSSDYKKATALYESGEYAEAAALFEKLDDYEDSAAMLEASQKALMLELYGPVIDCLMAEPWYFNGGSETTLNQLTFTQEEATLAQVYFHANGKGDNGSNTAPYRIDETAIAVTLADGSELEIPYAMDGDTLTLGNGDYYSESAVDAALQGYWTLLHSDNLLGISGTFAYHACIDNGKISYQTANTSAYNDYEYFYNGPHEGTYTLNCGGFDTDLRNGYAFGFNIVNNEVVLLRNAKIFSPTDEGFPEFDAYASILFQ